MQKADLSAASPTRGSYPTTGSASDDSARAQTDAELVASIKAHGLLENLVVVPRGKTLYGVAAGARRLRALKALADENHIPKHFPVP